MLDLSRPFQKYGTLLVKALTRRIQQGQSADNASTAYPPLKKSTIQGTPNRKGGRLYNTGEFSENVYQLETGPMYLTVRARPEAHTQGPTFADILSYHDGNSSDVNRRIYRGDSPTLMPVVDQFDIDTIPEMASFGDELIALAQAQQSLDLGPNKTVDMRFGP